MDSTLYKAALEGNTRDGDFLLDLLKRDEENGFQVTPKGNTILHVAAFFGRSRFVGEVLELAQAALLCRQNKRNETALHVAANEGHSEVVRVLLAGVEGDAEIKEGFMRMTDENGDTALHKAVRSGHADVVRLLVKEDPEFEFPGNKAEETPLYLAAESGFIIILRDILETCRNPTYDGPCHRTALHAAVIQQHTDCARSLWEWNRSLCEEPDKWGWNALHYAVKQGLKEVVSDMLWWKKSLAYLPAGGESDNWTTTFHIAASEGDANMLRELINHCPDCWESLDSNGQNALHVAILKRRPKTIKFLLESKPWDGLVEEADNDGNTPLHLVAASGDVPSELVGHPRAKKMTFNKENQTPLDIALSCTKSTNVEKRLFRWLLSHGRLGQRGFKIRKRENNKEREEEVTIEEHMKVSQMHLVVATLLVTVTFAAGFTLPGGFDSDPGPNKGMAILIRKAAFRAFVLSDAIAFTCSIGAVYSYFVAADSTTDMVKKPSAIVRLYYFAATLQFVAIGAVVIAFVTGMYTTLAHSPGLAIIVCVIGCLSFLAYSWVLRAIWREEEHDE